MIGLVQRFNHRYLNRHYAKRGSYIGPKYWSALDDDVIGVRCAICREWIKRP